MRYRSTLVLCLLGMLIKKTEIQFSVSFLRSGSLPSRQVQMSDVATPVIVGLLLLAFYILPPSSFPTSFVLVYLDLLPRIFPLITIFNSDSPLRVCPIHFFCWFSV